MSVITCRSNQLRGSQILSSRRSADALYNYVGGVSGAWEVTSLVARRGDSLAAVSHVDIVNGPLRRTPVGTVWLMSGLVRNTRYVSREEVLPPGAPRPVEQSPTCAALIPIRRSPEWWQLGQAARRELLQSQSRRTPVGFRFLSAILRTWQHRLDLSEQFDCVTWFEYEPRDSAAFEDLLADWRASEEWKYIDRECDIRLVRAR